MADFVAVLRRAIDSLETNTPETRAALYDKARAALLAQLKALDPPISEEDLAQQAETLDLAIARLEEEYAGPAGAETGARPAAAAEVDETAEEYAEEAGAEAAEAVEAARKDTGQGERARTASSTPAPVAAKPAAPAAAAAAAAAASGGQGASRPAGASPAAPPRPPQAAPPPGQGAAGAQRPPARPGQPSAAPGNGAPPRPRDGQYAGEEAAARSRASAAAYQAEAAANPPRRRGGALLWGGVAVLLLLAAVVGLWQSGLFTGGEPGGEIAEETKIDDRLAGDEGAEGAQSEFQAPAGEQAEAPVPEAPAQEEVAAPQEEVVPPPATAEQPRLTDQPTPPGASAQALLIEEASSGPGSANTLGGSVRWELVEENETQGPAQVISGTVSIPDRDLDLLITVRKNNDADLPASHTVELVFDAPAEFAGGGITNVPGMIMKATPRSTGQPLVGAVVPVTDNFFLVGLSESDLDRQRNVTEMRQRDFIDIPLIYENGGRAVLSIAKGEEGQQVFNQAFDAWQQ